MMTDDEKAAWLAARAGKLTASKMRDALDRKKDGTSGAKRLQLLKDLLAERLTGLSVRNFVSPAMEWGVAQEPEAKRAYEMATGVILGPEVFFDHPEIDNFGATPDALIAPDGLAEFKCPTTPTFVEWSLRGCVPDEHVPQMLVQLACSGRRWCDFVAFDPRIRDPKRQLFIRRFEPKRSDIERIEAEARDFLSELDAMFEQFTTAQAA